MSDSRLQGLLLRHAISRKGFLGYGDAYIMKAALIAALMLFPATFAFLPARVRVRGRIVPGKTELDFGLRLPLVPWYIPWRISGEGDGFSMGLPGRMRRLAGRGGQAGDPGGRGGQAGDPEGRGGQAGDLVKGRRSRPRSNLLRQARNGLRAFRKIYRMMMQATSILARTVEVEELFVAGWVGLEDAFQTAIATGSVVSALCVLWRTARKRGLVFDARPSISVFPSYTRQGFAFRFGVTVRSSLVRITRTVVVLRRMFQQTGSRAGHGKGKPSRNSNVKVVEY